MGVTIKDIAALAGVSKTAVSFAFNNPERISRSTYKKIMDVAKKAGYTPNPVARILSNRKTCNIGLVLPQGIAYSFLNPYTSELVRGIGSVCDQEEFALVILPPVKGLITQSIQNAAVDGIIISGIVPDSNVQKILSQRALPYITIDGSFSNSCCNIGIDDAKRAEELMDLLLDNGHRNICICSLQPGSAELQSEESPSTMQNRIQGINNSLAKHQAENIAAITYENIPTSFDGAYSSAMRLLQEKNRCTAIFCMGDIQAYGVYKAARELSVAIPSDISVVSFDDLPAAENLEPRLTSVHQSAYEKGRTGAKMLFKLINGGESESKIVSSFIHVEHSVRNILQ